MDFLLPDREQQAFLMHLIYDVVKATRPLQPEEENWSRLLRQLRDRGADYCILACTELPIVANTLQDPGPFVDPTAELARAAVLFCGYPLKEDPPGAAETTTAHRPRADDTARGAEDGSPEG